MRPFLKLRALLRDVKSSHLIAVLTACAITSQASVASGRIFNVEIDWLEDEGHSHKPQVCELDAIKAAFARHGHQWNYTLGTAITEDAANSLIEFASAHINANLQFDQAGTEWAALETAHRAGGAGTYYILFGHSFSVNGVPIDASGIAELPGDECLVSLGLFPGGIGTPWDRAATAMHEFGHTLGLEHAGNQIKGTAGKRKPNYPSVMNYRYQLRGVDREMECVQRRLGDGGFFDLDYSSGTLPDLNENALVEAFGVGLGPVDWNCDGLINAGTVARDVSTNVYWCPPGGTLNFLQDHNDWAEVAAGAVVSASSTFEFCISAEEAEQEMGLLDSGCGQPGLCGSLPVPAVSTWPAALLAATLMISASAWVRRGRHRGVARSYLRRP